MYEYDLLAVRATKFTDHLKLEWLRQPCSDLHASGRRFDTVRAHQCYSISDQRCSLAVRPTPRCAESEFNGS